MVTASDVQSTLLQTGTQRTVFLDNAATKSAGDILAIDKAAVHISGALLAGAKAGSGGGSIQLESESIMRIVNTSIQGARAWLFGGCACVTDNATLWVTNSEPCQAAGQAQTVVVYIIADITHTARLALTNSTISQNTAGWGTARDHGSVSGGGIAAKNASTIQLAGVAIHSNTAFREGGGVGVYENASLVVGRTKTHVYHNKAGTLGGGLRLLSANFDPAQLTGLVMVYSNSAHYSGNIVISATSTTVVDRGGADSVIASDSKDTTLVLTLSVSGPHGWPSEEFIWVSLSTFGNEVLGTLQPTQPQVPVLACAGFH